MIATTNLAKEYGARVLFADVSLQLNPGSRYGLVGANGSGKTTFLKVLAGDEEASAGTVTIAKRARVGVLRQDRFLDDEAIILDLAMRGDAVVWNALEEQRRLTAARRCRRCRAASSCASFWRRCWWAASTCCCSTSRPITSTF